MLSENAFGQGMLARWLGIPIEGDCPGYEVVDQLRLHISPVRTSGPFLLWLIVCGKDKVSPILQL